MKGKILPLLNPSNIFAYFGIHGSKIALQISVNVLGTHLSYTRPILFNGLLPF